MTSQSYGLFLDIQAAQAPRSAERGIGRLVVEHARALVAWPDLVRGVAISPLFPFPGRLPAELHTSPLLTWNTATAMKRASRMGPTAYYVMCPFEENIPSQSPHPPDGVPSGTPVVVTLYDLIPLVMADKYLCDPQLAELYEAQLELVRNADLVLVISEYTRRDALRLLDLDPDRVVYIGAGVTSWFRPPLSGSDPQYQVCQSLPQIRRPFVLCVSGDDPRKNHEALISAFARLSPATRASHQLIITARLQPPVEEKWRRHARKVGLGADELILTGYVSDPLMRSLYQSAALSVFPSLYEGFGLPVIEAAACGCPTITSNTTSLPEILDWEPSTFDPNDPDAIAAAMERALGDRDFREQLRSIGIERAGLHSWEAVAERTVAALQRLPAPRTLRRRSDPRKKPTRLALVGPLPPAHSGIADYNGRLARELARRCELDLFCENTPGHDGTGEIAGLRYLPVSSLGVERNPGAYDAIIYTIGNSDHHYGAYAAAKRWPGIVWFHDILYSGFYSALGVVRNPADSSAVLREQLLEQYGPRVPAEAIYGFSKEIEARFGLRLTAEWVRSARALIVHSQFAEQMLRLDQGPDAALPPAAIIPHAIPAITNPNGVGRDSPPVIASFGIVHHAKLPTELIAAVALVRQLVAARLVFVGPYPEEFRRDLERYAKRLGIADDLDFTGHVSKSVYQEWLWRATCAVQLRIPTTGVQSGAICDAVAAGLPVITNLLGMDEGFLSDAIIKLEPYFAVDELAAQLISLLAETDLWRTHHLAALRQAPRWTFDNVAEEVLNLVSTLEADGRSFRGSK